MFLKIAEHLLVAGSIGGDPDEFADRDHLLLEDFTGKRRVFCRDQYDIISIHESITELLERRGLGCFTDIFAHLHDTVSDVLGITGMVGVIDKAVLMGDDIIKRALKRGIGIVAEAFDETLD